MSNLLIKSSSLFFFCALSGIVLAFFYIFSHYVQQPLTVSTLTPPVAQALSTTSEPFEILYTSEGFTPDRLEVPVGAEVFFRNTTDIPLWVASDPHPTHTDYPVFDAQKAYTMHEEYRFTFTRTGAFSYHNHDKHGDKGFVSVTDPVNLLPHIDKTPLGQRALRDTYIAMLDPKEHNSIFKIVDALQADPVLSRNCHDIAHDVGHKAYELYGFSEAMTFNNPEHVKHALVQYICAGGYLHGILEQLSLHQPEFLTHPDTMCSTVPEADRASCFHGVGHVYMLAQKRDATASIESCRQVEQNTDMYRCFEGVRMEQFWGGTETSETDGLGWDPERPLAPCVAAVDDAKPTCFLYSPFGYLRTHVKDYPGAVSMCTESGLNESDAGFCLKGLGITMMSKFKGKHLEGSEIYMNGRSDMQKMSFYKGVLGYAHLSGVKEGELSYSCNLFKTDSAICRSALASILD